MIPLKTLQELTGNTGKLSQIFLKLKDSSKVDAVVKELKALAKKAEEIFLATDPDREGEAIAWHLLEAAEMDPQRVQRVVFHEITQGAIGIHQGITLALQSTQLFEQQPAFSPRQPQVLTLRIRVEELDRDSLNAIRQK